nr:DUF1868 domain-containing protein [uncultured Cohaesibacter sp.]
MTITRRDPIAYMAGALSDGERPTSITEEGGGGKFTPDGKALPFAGNTFLCHIDPSSRAYRALVSMQKEIKAGPFAHLFAFLPADSLHMTLFQGVSPGCISLSEGWPKDIPLGSSRDSVTQTFVQRLTGQHLPTGMNVTAGDLFALHSVTVCGATPQDEQMLRQVREILSQLTSIRYHAHDSYIFHVTLAYPLSFTDKDTATAIHKESARLFARYEKDLSDISMAAVEFCNYETMLQFEPVMVFKD